MGESKEHSTLDRVVASAAPAILATSFLSIVGLLWTMQTTIVEIKASQTRILEIAKNTSSQLVQLEERVRVLEVKTAK